MSEQNAPALARRYHRRGRGVGLSAWVGRLGIEPRTRGLKGRKNPCGGGMTGVLWVVFPQVNAEVVSATTADIGQRHLRLGAPPVPKRPEPSGSRGMASAGPHSCQPPKIAATIRRGPNQVQRLPCATPVVH
jgi:hypothetical protein